jgi:UDPglucose 6-dehydrogenase
VVNKSTVPVGSFHLVGDALGRDDVAVVSNPEFLREGTAVHDFLNPDRVVIGADDERAAEMVASLYRSLDTEIVFTDPTSAELIKYAANGFLAMKISFINSVAALCEHVGADITKVCPRHRHRRPDRFAFLQPGPGWGGSCFPKDSRALVSTAAQHGYDFSLMRGVIDINEQQYHRMAHKVMRRSAGPCRSTASSSACSGSPSRPAPTTCGSRRASGW